MGREKCFNAIGSVFGYDKEVLARTLYNKAISSKAIYNQAFVVSWGKGKECGKYYVLRMTYPISGLAACMRQVLKTYDWCRINDYKLIVYFGDNEIQVEDVIGDNFINCWEELFVQQPKLSELIKSNKSSRIIFSPINERGVREYARKIYEETDKTFLFLDSSEKGRKYREVYREVLNNSIVIRQDVKNEYEETYMELCKKGMRKCLGILMREEFASEWVDKNNQESEDNRPICLNREEMIKQAKKIMMETGCETIFLASVYNSTIKMFEEHFEGGTIYYINRERIEDLDDNLLSLAGKYSKKVKSDYRETVVQDHGCVQVEKLKKLNNVYLQELWILSRCESFFSSTCGGGFIVPLLRDTEFKKIVYAENKNRDRCTYG